MVSLLVLLLLLLVEPFESRKLAKTGKVEVLDLTDPAEELLPQDESDEDRILPDETDPCLTKTVVYTRTDDIFFDPDLMQVVVVDTPVCNDEDLEDCTSPDGLTEFGNVICHVIDPCFEEGCMSTLLCSEVITEEELGVICTGSGIAELDLTLAEDGLIIGTSDMMFQSPLGSGKITSEFDEDVATHTVCYTSFV